MVSPLNEDLGIDAGSVHRLVEHLVSNRNIPFILGTTGESASMTVEQKILLAGKVVEANGDRGPVLAGISSNSMEESVGLAREFARLGIEAAVATLPSYYPMDSEQMFRYMDLLASRIPIPLMLYNMPITTGLSIPTEIAERLSHHPNIAGIKDSERDDERLERSLRLWSGREDFSFLLGWAPRSVHALTAGAEGIVPSTANLFPDLHYEMYSGVIEGNREKAESLQEQTDRISQLYQEGRTLNRSIPALKVLLSMKGLCKPHVLPPLSRMGEAEEKRYIEEMEEELKKLTA